MNDDARAALEQSVARLRQLRIGALPTQLSIINAELARAQTELNRRELIAAHLVAAGTTVQPMPAELEQELRDIGARLDEAIRADAIVTAALETVVDILKEGRKLAAEIQTHT